MFKGLGDLGSLMKQAQEIQGRMAQVKEKVSDLRVEGIAGGEMVRVQATGDMKITAIHIDPSLMETQDREMIEELVAAATNHALQKAKTAATDAMSEATEGLNIPGLGDVLSKFGGGGTV